MGQELGSGISAVFVCSDLKVRDIVIRIIEETAGIKPAFAKDTVSAKRAMYAPAISRVIINTASREMHEKLGKHYAAAVVEVYDPVDAATRGADICLEAGLVAQIYLDPEPEFPPGFITFLSFEGLEGFILLFWPKNPDPAILAKLDKPVPWPDK